MPKVLASFFHAKISSQKFGSLPKLFAWNDTSATRCIDPIWFIKSRLILQWATVEKYIVNVIELYTGCYCFSSYLKLTFSPHSLLPHLFLLFMLMYYSSLPMPKLESVHFPFAYNSSKGLSKIPTPSFHGEKLLLTYCETSQLKRTDTYMFYKLIKKVTRAFKKVKRNQSKCFVLAIY